MKTIRINVPLTVRHTVLTPLGPSTISRVEAEFDGVSVTIGGMRDAVDRILSTMAPSDPHSLIQRALSALGHVVGDHKKDVEQFSQWVDHLVAFPRTDEARNLWTEAMLRAAQSPYPISVSDASRACFELVLEQARLFPPSPKVDLGDAELQEWRSAAKTNGIGSPKELAESANMSFGQFVDRKISREWQAATLCATPADAAILRASLIRDCGNMAHEKADENAQWQASTECDTPEFQSKCREAQTERERANTAERMFRVEQAKRESEVRAERERADSLAEKLRECDDIISRAREFAGLAQHDTKSIVDWCRDAREKLATAIIPLPKPEKVEAGQKWAFVMTAKSGLEPGNRYLAGRFADSERKDYAAFHGDLLSGFYLGT